MKCSMIHGRIGGPVRSVLAASLTLICVATLFAADVKRVATAEAMKAATSKRNPEYNAVTKLMKLSGDVALDVTIAEEGTVEAVIVLTGNPVLAKLATDAIKQWKFIPFKFDGKASKVVTEIVIRFKTDV